MILPRRAVLGLLALPLAAPMLARPARAADCRAFDLERGIRFERGDVGGSGLATLDEGGVEIVYDLPGESHEWRRVTGGVFEVERVVRSGEGADLNGSEQICTMTYAATLPAVEAGGGWDGQVTEVCKEMATGTRMYKVLSQSRAQWAAIYRFGPMIERELSGCVFEGIEVTMTATSGIVLRNQRWLWIPALGLGLEEARNGVDLPLTAMAPL